MIGEFVLRFVLGGLIVSAFAVLGDVLKPKSFAGIFGAAPSVALATLGITFATKGGAHAAIEGHSMIAGAVAFCAYSWLVSRLLLDERWNPFVAAGLSWLLWLAVAFAIWAVWLR